MITKPLVETVDEQLTEVYELTRRIEVASRMHAHAATMGVLNGKPNWGFAADLERTINLLKQALGEDVK